MLGRTGLKVSMVAIGTWQAGGRLWGRIRREEFFEAIGRAVELGVNLYDTAELYGNGRSERLLGEALRRAGALGEAVVVTKVAGYRVTWRGFKRALEGSTGRLGRRPDLVLYHWPPPAPFTVCRVARLMERLVEHGLTGWVGFSNFNAHQLEEAASCMKRYEPVAVQVHYSLAHRTPENKLIPTARRYGLTVMAWGPLAKGALAGKTKPDNMARLTDPVYLAAARDKELQQALAQAAHKYGVSKAVIALAWLVSKNTIPVVGVRSRRHVEDAARAASIGLDSETIHMLDKVSDRYRRRWGECYSELAWNRLLPPPLQALIYRVILRGI